MNRRNDMKKIFLTFSILIGLCMSCKDGSEFVDPVSNTGLNKEVVFGDALLSERYLSDIYSRILPVLPRTDGAGGRWRTHVMLEVATDNGISITNGAWQIFNSGAWNASNGASSLFSTADWNEGYAAIRTCNLYLENADNIPVNSQANFTEEIRKRRKAEAKWLLAFNYAELAKQFGGLPLIKDVIDPGNVPQYARSSYDETIAYIVQLCDEAAADLPLSQPDSDLGRATKGAALALKARMLLYAASPLWNDPSNDPGDDPNKLPVYGKPDDNKWVKAAQAAADVIKLGVYDLHPDLSTLFNTRTNSEIIFARMQEPMAYLNNIIVPYKLYSGTGAAILGGFSQSTYNMIKEYEIIKDGVAYSIDDPASGYNPQDPYKNRDPRFYRDNIYNGAKVTFGGIDKTAEFGEVAAGVAKTPAHNYPLSPTSAFVYNVKFADLTLNITADARTPANNPRTNQNYPYLRYAEVLLNYAEAMNVAHGNNADPYGTGMTALQALNKVRTRARYVAGKPEYLGYTGGMPEIASGLNKDQFTAKLRHERRVELCYEEHRFWDVRRWKITPETVIQAQVPVWTSPTTVQYQITTIETRPWLERMYRMPIPQPEVLLNPALIQNPGWE